ncbi:MAG: branched-chain amino acid ABC transporter permease, partial [Firmicutes bacterium]|nr:branched-chain amino acid ABC transporter permease [Bacillota bacterium]
GPGPRWLLAAAAVAAAPFIVNNGYLLGIGIVIGIHAPVVLGLILLMNYAGQVSLGQAAFYGLGAYTAGILTATYGWPSPVALVAAVLVPGAVAAVVGRPLLRLREQYLALATLGLGILVHIAFNEAKALTGGPSGLLGIPYFALGPVVFDRDTEFFHLVWFVNLGLLWLAGNLVRSPAGRALRAIHDSEVAAQAVGIDTGWWKWQVLIFSALLAGLAGGLYAFYVCFVSPSPFGLVASIEFVLMAVLGGGSIWGALWGAAAVTVLVEVLRAVVPLVHRGAGGEFEIIGLGVLLVGLLLWRYSGGREPVQALRGYRGRSWRLLSGAARGNPGPDRAERGR